MRAHRRHKNMSWEDSDDYAGPAATWWGVAFIALMFLGGIALVVWLVFDG